MMTYEKQNLQEGQRQKTCMEILGKYNEFGRQSYMFSPVTPVTNISVCD